MPGGYLNKSTYNSLVYKPMNLALVLVTELLATITDVTLILKVIKSHDSVNQEKSKKFLNAPKDLISNYAVSWLLIGADIFIKSMNMIGKPWLFDSIITMMTIAMRAKCNLEFGLHLKHILSTNVKSGTGEKSSRFEKSSKLQMSPSAGKLVGPASTPPEHASVPDLEPVQSPQ